MQSNQFDFSVVDKEIAEKLMVSSGKQVQVHYKEYFAPLPWRGYTKFVVDSIISIEEIKPDVQQDLTPYVLEGL